jgi:tRNA A-37 threonylcarbamoyl transferase component Bud32
MSRDSDPVLSGMSGKIAAYRLDGFISQSANAVVYLALDERSGARSDKVALKVLAPELARDPAFHDRFLHEARAAAAVDHPNIIPVYAADDADGTLYVAMRYVQGGDARSLVGRAGALPFGWASNIIVQVAAALDAAHANGVIHRDVKPTNMLLDSSAGPGSLFTPRRADGGDFDHVYLSDFGMSTNVPTGETAATVQVNGTLDYVAPEQIEGRAIDSRADQYSLACAAFELLCGAPPFGQDQGLTVMYAQMYAPPPTATAQRPELPPAVDRVLATALAKNPADRYLSCGLFAEELHAALGLASGRPSDFGASPALPVGPPPPAAAPAPPAVGMRSPAGSPSPGLAWPVAAAGLAAAGMAAGDMAAGGMAAGDEPPAPEAWGQEYDEEPMLPEAPFPSGPGWFRDEPAGPGGPGDPGGPGGPGAAMPGAAMPGATAPVRNWAEPGGPGVTAPGANWGDVVGSGVTSPGGNWPGAGGPGVTAPGNWPGAGGPAATAPGNWPGAGGPGLAGPGLAGPGTAGPGPGSADPMGGPGGPKPPPRRGRINMKLAAIGTAVVLLAVAGAVGVELTKHPAPSKPAATAPSASPAASVAALASQQAASVNTLLGSSLVSRRALADAVGDVRGCAHVPLNVGHIERVVNRRSAEYHQAKALSTGALPNGTVVKADLLAALRNSLAADRAYLTWARQQMHSGCTPAGHPDAAYSTAIAADSQAAASKQQFVRVWNPIAAKYGLPQKTATSI